MQINYPTKVLWRKPVSTETPVFSGKKLKRLRSLLAKTDELNISYTTARLDESFLSWFVPAYEANIQSKENGKVYDVRDRTFVNPVASYDYYAITITQNDTPVAGAIFSDRPQTISVAFKVAENTWPTGNAQLGPSLLLEHILYEFALTHTKQHISMGMDANPYGINSSIGLAEYKLSSGYRPLVPKTHEIITIDTDDISEEALIFAMPESGREITTAFLVNSQLGADARITKYPEITEIITL